MSEFEQHLAIPAAIPRRKLLFFTGLPVMAAMLASCGSETAGYEDEFIKAQGSFPETLMHPEHGKMLVTFKPAALEPGQRRHDIVWQTFKMRVLGERRGSNSLHTVWAMGQTTEVTDRRVWTWDMGNLDPSQKLNLGFEWQNWILHSPTRNGKPMSQPK